MLSKLSERWIVRDDRGQSIDILAIRKPSDKSIENALKKLASRNGTTIARLQAICFLAFMLLGAIMLVAAAGTVLIGLTKVLSSSALRAQLAALIGVGVLTSAVMFLIVTVVSHSTGLAKRQKVRTLGARLANHHCGSCDYQLTGVIPESDLCTVCPECRAAWRMDLWERDWGRRHPVHLPRFENKWRVYPVDMLVRPFLINRPQSIRVRILLFAWLRQQLIPSILDVFIIGLLSLFLSSTTLTWDEWRRLLSNFEIAVSLVLLIAMRAVWAVIGTKIHIVQSCIRKGACPHCERSLRSECAHGDGSILCEHCGAAYPSANLRAMQQSMASRILRRVTGRA
ncbi:MAG: hypothetical protein U0640_06345 [Phycisphaerales bacterium]